MKNISKHYINKFHALCIVAAVAALVSINAYAHTNDYMGFGGFSPFGGFGYGFAGYGMDFGGHHFDGHFAGDFSGYGHGFTVQHAFNRKIVPIPATASVNTSITYDENGEIHVRPFDDEDLFTEE